MTDPKLQPQPGDSQEDNRVEATQGTRSSQDMGEKTSAGQPSGQTPATADGETIVRPGQQLGPYLLLDKLGEGGMGAVYKARHTRLNKIVALKVLPAHLTRDPNALGRFDREMKAVGALEHPNIVRAMDANEHQGTHYLVMEYVEGRDLQQIVKQDGPFSGSRTAELIRQAAQALAYAHKHGLVHRDIKPSNLFLTNEGQIKILDLGLARLSQEENDGLTSTGASMGTPDYMAPEQWADTHSADGRSDLYALGCTIFYLLTGRPPFSADKHKSIVNKMTAHVYEPPPSLTAICSAAPKELDEIYQRLMAKDVNQRLATAVELVQLLEPFCEVVPDSKPTVKKSLTISDAPVTVTLGSAGKPAAAPATSSPRKSRRIPAIVAWGASLLALVAIAVVFLNRPTKPSDVPVSGKGSQGWSTDAPPAIAPFDKEQVKQNQKPAHLFVHDPAFTQWMNDVQGMAAEDQLKAVAQKLTELNRGFEGKLTGAKETELPKIESGVVTELGFDSEYVVDLSPVRALKGLKVLNCSSQFGTRRGKVRDLSPLAGLQLSGLLIADTNVSDLTPLRGMPLTSLICYYSRVYDLSPLQEVPLKILWIGATDTANLEPIKGLPLESLACNATKVSDLSPLDGMKLTFLCITPEKITRGMNTVRDMTSLEFIESDGGARWMPQEFWQMYDAGYFSKPRPADIDFVAERNAAEWVLAAKGTVVLEDEAGQKLPLENGQLPAGKFAVAEIDFDQRAKGNVSASDLGKLSGCSRLRQLLLGSIVENLTDKQFEQFPLREPLAVLQVDRTQIGDETVFRAAKVSTLRELGIRHTRVTDSGLAAIAKHGRLNRLYLGSPGITRAAIRDCVGGNPDMSWLSLESSEPNLLDDLAPHPNLVTIRCEPAQMTAPLVDILNQCPKFQQPILACFDVPFPKETFDQICRLRTMTSVELSQFHADPIDARFIRQLAAVKSLAGMKISDGADDACLAAAAEIPTLKWLIVTQHDCTPAGIAEVRRKRPDMQLVVDGKEYPAAATAPAAIDYVAERKAAEWVLSKNGTVDVENEAGHRSSITTGPLPAGNVLLRNFSLPGNSPLAAGDLARFSACRGLQTIDLRHVVTATEAIVGELEFRPPLDTLHLDDLNITDATIERAALVPTLTRLTFGGPELTDRAFLALGKQGNLEQLQFNGCPRTTAKGVAACVRGNPRLWLLNLSISLPETPSIGIKEHPSLKALGCSQAQFTAECVAALNTCPNFESLAVGTEGVPYAAETFDRIAQVKNLRRLMVAHFPPLDPIEAQLFLKLKGTPSLTSLDIGSGCDDAGLAAIAQIPSLKHLTVTTRNATDAGINEFRQVRPDVAFTINGQTYPALAPIDYAAERQAAEWALARGEVDLVDAAGKPLPFVDKKLPDVPFAVWKIRVAAKDDELAALAACRRLESASFHHLEGPGLAHLVDVTSLRSLELPSAHMTDAGLESLPRLGQLTSLNLDYSTHATDEALRPVGALKHLRSLGIVLPNVTDEGLKHLDGLTELSRFSVGSPKVSAAGIEAFCKAHPKLSDLYLDHAQIKLQDLKPQPEIGDLAISTKFLTDDALAAVALWPKVSCLRIYTHEMKPAASFSATGWQAIAQMRPLNALIFQGSPPGFDDDCLAALTRAPALKSISLPRPEKLTGQGLAAFHKARPEVSLTIDGKEYPAAPPE